MLALLMAEDGLFDLDAPLRRYLPELTGPDGEETISWVANTYPFNLTRSPAGTVCAGLTADGMPVGLQVVGPQHGDLAVVRTMAFLEAAIGFSERPTL